VEADLTGAAAGQGHDVELDELVLQLRRVKLELLNEALLVALEVGAIGIRACEARHDHHLVATDGQVDEQVALGHLGQNQALRTRLDVAVEGGLKGIERVKVTEDEVTGSRRLALSHSRTITDKAGERVGRQRIADRSKNGASQNGARMSVSAKTLLRSAQYCTEVRQTTCARSAMTQRT
jgi:hypothetical protein